MSGKRERRGVGDANASSCVHVYRIPWGSCSVKCFVCSEGSEGDGPSKGEPGVSAAKALQWNRKACPRRFISQTSSPNTCKKLGMKLESWMAPDDWNVPSAQLQRPSFWWVLGVWARWHLIHLPSQNTSHGRERRWGRQTLFSCSHCQGKRQWAQIKPHEISSEHRQNIF